VAVVQSDGWRLKRDDKETGVRRLLLLHQLSASCQLGGNV
jgi:hypothetical protein